MTGMDNDVNKALVAMLDSGSAPKDWDGVRLGRGKRHGVCGNGLIT